MLQNPLGGNTTNPTVTLIPGVGGPSIPPSQHDSSPSSSGGESPDEEKSSLEPSQPSTPSTPMENQNNLAKPWLDRDFLAILRPQHPLPKHPEKWMTKFDPDSKQFIEDHIKKIVLAIRL